MTFAQKTIMELVKKSGASSVPTDFIKTIESVFESQGGLWERIAKGEAEQIGLLKKAVRSVLTGEVKPLEKGKEPKSASGPTPHSRAVSSLVTACEQVDYVRHLLKPTVMLASRLGVDVTEAAQGMRDQLDGVLSRTSNVGETDRVNTLAALDDLISEVIHLGSDLLEYTQQVRAWQIDGGADHPFHQNVVAKSEPLQRTIGIEKRAYRSPWDAFRVVSSSVSDLGLEPKRFLKGRVEMRLVPFFHQAAETLGRVP